MHVTSPYYRRCDATLVVFPFTACVCVCNHSDVAHSALDRSNGISAPMKPPGHTIPALSELRGTIRLKTNIPHVLES